VSTTILNELLSAAWDARKNDLSAEAIQWQTKLDKDFSNLVYYFICVLGYSHDEFLNLMRKFHLINKS
jgi:hypothetical protein